MRNPPHNVKAPKQTVSATINSDLYAQAKQLDINVSQVAEEALIQEVARRKAELVRTEILQDLTASSSYIAKHGSFADMARDHYADPDEE